MTVGAPMSLLAELTHRCPLSCFYCSNPLQLEKRSAELTTELWKSVLDQAARMGVLQVHFSGGEPMARADLAQLIEHARALDLYTNLITSGILLKTETLIPLDKAGLDHIQLSFQDVTEKGSSHIGGLSGSLSRKLEAAHSIQRAGIPLTLNFVVHQQNIERIPAMFELARTLKAQRVEIAHTQYYGWGLKNRDFLLPSRHQLEQATAIVAAEEKRGGLAIDYVTPDYYADFPKPCMGGWGRRFINITPSGRVLPCHAAETIPHVSFPNVQTASLHDIWWGSELFNRFRGTEWMPEPCRSCLQKDRDWGGCRCQALALTGRAENTDPVCRKSGFRTLVDKTLLVSDAPYQEPTYRHFPNT